MILVLDSNVLFHDFHMDRPRLRLVRSQAKAGSFTLAVPELVVLETINLYREEAEAAAESLSDRSEKPLERLGELKIPAPMPEFDIGALVDVYEKKLRKMLEDVNAEVPDLPGIPESEIVKRALNRRKPFKKSDAGYRDTLIWHNILALAEQDEVILISENHSDFAENKDEPAVLASDLQDDLEEASLPREQVRLLSQVAAFIKEHVPESAQVRQEVQDRLAATDGEFYEDFEAQLREGLSNYRLSFEIPGVLEFGTDEVILPYSGDEDGAEIDEVGELRELEVTDARVEGDDGVLEVEGIADVSLSYFIPKWEMGELEHESGPKVFVLDWDWNDHYLWAAVTKPIRFEAVATYKAKGEKLESLEISRIADD
jgi:predicted nucleic acid-binding protein